MTKQKEMTDLQTSPSDWTDRKAWDRYLHAHSYQPPFPVPTEVGAPGWQAVRFLDLVQARGGRVWFPGCGTDIAPRFYSTIGCAVVATDFSPVALRSQTAFAASPPARLFKNWSAFVQQRKPNERQLRNRRTGLYHRIAQWSLRRGIELPRVSRFVQPSQACGGSTLFRRAASRRCRRHRHNKRARHHCSQRNRRQPDRSGLLSSLQRHRALVPGATRLHRHFLCHALGPAPCSVQPQQFRQGLHGAMGARSKHSRFVHRRVQSQASSGAAICSGAQQQT